MTIHRADSLVLLIDVQERLAPAIEGGGQVVQRLELLLHAARRLEVPALASEQYRKGLGLTLATLCEYLPPESPRRSAARASGRSSSAAWSATSVCCRPRST